MNIYLATSKEFQPIVVTKTTPSGTSVITTNVKYVAVPKGTPLADGVLTDVVDLNGEIGFFTNTLAPGYWDIGAKITDNPEIPLIKCGTIRIKE